MNWRAKAFAHTVMSSVPNSAKVNRLAQRYVTRSLPASEAAFARTVATAERHILAIRRHEHRDLGRLTFYEFGAGADLMIPLSLYAFGVRSQVLVDVRRLASAELVNDTIEKCRRFQSTSPASWELVGSNLNRELELYYGIQYRAPADARSTRLEPGSMNSITSTNTLEHISPRDIPLILAECHRILNSDGVFSVQIDYQDHYAYFDPGISVYNFLKYSDRSWRFFSPSLHYQNRMRHPDYLELFSHAGFELVEESRLEGSANDLRVIEGLHVDPRFRRYDPLDVAVRSSFLLLKKR